MGTYYKNGATVTVTPTTAWKGEQKELTASQLISGFNPNLDNISLSGRVKRGGAYAVAKVVVEADTGKYFSSPPYLKTKSRNISLRLVSKLRENSYKKNLMIGDGMFYTSYTYDL